MGLRRACSPTLHRTPSCTAHMYDRVSRSDDQRLNFIPASINRTGDHFVKNLGMAQAHPSARGLQVRGMLLLLLLCMAWTGEAQQQLSGALRLSRRNAVPCTYLAANPGSFGGGACVRVALFESMCVDREETSLTTRSCGLRVFPRSCISPSEAAQATCECWGVVVYMPFMLWDPSGGLIYSSYSEGATDADKALLMRHTQ